jgi:hypothetical protein
MWYNSELSTLQAYWPYVTDRVDSDLCSNIVFFTLDKIIDTELQNGITYTAFEEQWGSHSALKVDEPHF